MGKYLFFSFITHFFRLEIQQILENSKVVSVRRDGHCLIYAWEIALRASASSHFKLSYDILGSLIHMEFNENLKKYCEFLVTENVNAAVAKYLNEKFILKKLEVLSLTSFQMPHRQQHLYIQKVNLMNFYRQTLSSLEQKQ